MIYFQRCSDNGGLWFLCNLLKWDQCCHVLTEFSRHGEITKCRSEMPYLEFYPILTWLGLGFCKLFEYCEIGATLKHSKGIKKTCSGDKTQATM